MKDVKYNLDPSVLLETLEKPSVQQQLAMVLCAKPAMDENECSDEDATSVMGSDGDQEGYSQEYDSIVQFLTEMYPSAGIELIADAADMMYIYDDYDTARRMMEDHAQHEGQFVDRVER